ncbi:MAG: cytochrome bd-I oxidase subunit CydX [Hyphomicrobiaceae bacterium]|nr:cytochrome bd-I oxidase subunit CydX [Hyphomicrobiaceae bacterium]MCC0009726.1 cytochrome bd-I oxidase subunit CydX [Hyphomicrobiaceae bacterium]
MWYFTWILGVTAALAFGVINVMWYEFQEAFDEEADSKVEPGKTSGREESVG